MLLLRSSSFFASALHFCLQQGSPLGSHADSQPFVSSTGCDDGQLPVLLPATDPNAGNAWQLLSELDPQKDEEKSADAEDCIQSRYQGP